MKALVLEKRNGLAAVLREDGVYVTTAQPCEVGETIELSEKVVALPRRKNRWLRSAVAAMLALVLFTGSYSYLAATAHAYVSLDVEEASVEVSVNRLGRVISVNALNEDSAELAHTLNEEMRGKKVEDAMTDAMEHFREDGVFEDPEQFVIAGVTSGSEERREALAETVERAAREVGAKDGEIFTFEVSRDERREARDQDMSGGRFAFEQRGGERPDAPKPAETAQEVDPVLPAQDSAASPPLENAPSGSAAPSDRPAAPTAPDQPGPEAEAEPSSTPEGRENRPAEQAPPEEGGTDPAEKSGVPDFASDSGTEQGPADAPGVPADPPELGPSSDHAVDFDAPQPAEVGEQRDVPGAEAHTSENNQRSSGDVPTQRRN